MQMEGCILYTDEGNMGTCRHDVVKGPVVLNGGRTKYRRNALFVKRFLQHKSKLDYRQGIKNERKKACVQ